MKAITVYFTESMMIEIDRYSKLSAEVYRAGSMSSNEREDLRSYASSIVSGMLLANPQNFELKKMFHDIYEKENHGTINIWNDLPGNNGDRIIES